MRRRFESRIEPLLVMVLILLPTALPLAHAASTSTTIGFTFESATWEDGKDFIEPESGDGVVPLIVKVVFAETKNKANTIFGVSATSNLTGSGFTNSTGGSIAKTSVAGVYSVGDEISFPFYLNIDKNLSLGVYWIELEIESLIDTGSLVTDATPYTLTVPLKVLGRPNIIHILRAENPKAGWVNKIVLEVFNNGTSAAYSLDTTFSAQSTSILNASRPWSLDYLPSGASWKIPMDLYVNDSMRGRVVEGVASTRYRTAYETAKNKSDVLPFSVDSKDSTIFEAGNYAVVAGLVNHVSPALVNNVGQTMFYVEIEARTSPPFGIVGKSEWLISKLESGRRVELGIDIYAPTSSVGLIGGISLVVKSRDQFGGITVDNHTLGFAVVETAEKVSSIVIHSSASQLERGRVNQVTLAIENVGSDAFTEVELALVSMNEAQLVGSEGRWIYSVLPGKSAQQIPIQIFVPEASPNTATLAFTLKSTNALGEIKLEQRTLQLIIVGSVVSSVSITPSTSEIYAGTTTDYDLEILNVGSEDLVDLEISVTITEPAAITSGDGHWTIPVLKAGEKQVLSMNVFTPEEARGKKARVSLILDYMAGPLKRTESRTIDAAFRGLVELSVIDLSILPLPAEEGSTLTVSGSIFNSGVTTAKAVNVTLIASHPFEVGPLRLGISVGDVDEGSQVPFSMSTAIAKGSAGSTYPLELQVYYKDDLGVWKSFRKTILVPVAVASQTSTGNSGSQATPPNLILPAVLGIVIGAAVTFSVMKLLSRRKKSS